MLAALYDICVAYLAKNIHLINFTAIPTECIVDLKEEIMLEQLGGAEVVRMCDPDALLKILIKHHPTSILINQSNCDGAFYYAKRYNSVHDMNMIDTDFGSRPIVIDNVFYSLSEKPKITSKDFYQCKYICRKTPTYYKTWHMIVLERYISDKVRTVMDLYPMMISSPFKVAKPMIVSDPGFSVISTNGYYGSSNYMNDPDPYTWINYGGTEYDNLFSDASGLISSISSSTSTPTRMFRDTSHSPFPTRIPMGTFNTTLTTSQTPNNNWAMILRPRATMVPDPTSSPIPSLAASYYDDILLDVKYLYK